MKKIHYKIPLIKQDIDECVQAAAAQILPHYGLNKTFNQITREIPAYKTHDGKKVGSALGHIALYFQKLGLKTTIHTTDIQIFDPSWSKLSRSKLIDQLRLRRSTIDHPTYDDLAFKAIFDGYIRFLKAEGKIIFPIFSETYLISLLKKGPIFAVVSYNFLNQTSKSRYDELKAKLIKDPVDGHTSTHAIVINGFYQGNFYVTDPDQKFGGRRRIKSDLLIGSLYLAQTDYDSMIITLKK